MLLNEHQRWTIINALRKEAQTCRTVVKYCGPQLTKKLKVQIAEYEEMAELIENAKAVEVSTS